MDLWERRPRRDSERKEGIPFASFAILALNRRLQSREDAAPTEVLKIARS